MNISLVIGFLNLLFIGIFAGEEFAICYGVRAALTRLDQRPHIQLRQALIRRLRVLVPALLALTVFSGIAATLANGFDAGFAFRCAGLTALLVFILVTFLGTVPINQAALAWNADAPPAGWHGVIARWERLDIVRCWSVVTAFILFLIAMAAR